MSCDLFIPYNLGASTDINDNLNGYYKTEQDYADALINEDRSNGSQVYSVMQNGTLSSTISYNGFGRTIREVEEKIVFAKAECKLLTPNGADYETVDSMIDKFASQSEFLITAHFDMSKMEGEFEEELREWARETLNIRKYSIEMFNKGIPKGEIYNFVEKNIPRRNLRLSFLNKSGKMVNFTLKSCEIEQKLARNRYLLYVKRMEILK